MNKGKFFAILGSFFQAGYLGGFFYSIYTINNSYNEIYQSDDYSLVALTQDLSRAFGVSLVSFYFLFSAILTFMLSFFVFKYKREWFYKVLFVSSISWLFKFPFGTAIGIYFLIMISKSKEKSLKA